MKMMYRSTEGSVSFNNSGNNNDQTSGYSSSSHEIDQ